MFFGSLPWFGAYMVMWHWSLVLDPSLNVIFQFMHCILLLYFVLSFFFFNVLKNKNSTCYLSDLRTPRWWRVKVKAEIWMRISTSPAPGHGDVDLYRRCIKSYSGFEKQRGLFNGSQSNVRHGDPARAYTCFYSCGGGVVLVAVTGLL